MSENDIIAKTACKSVEEWGKTREEGDLTAKKEREPDGLTVNERNAHGNGLEIYNKYAEKQIAEAFSGYHDWSVFENEHTTAGLTGGKLTGTAVLLKACAKLRPFDSCA